MRHIPQGCIQCDSMGVTPRGPFFYHPEVGAQLCASCAGLDPDDYEPREVQPNAAEDGSDDYEPDEREPDFYYPREA